MFLTRKIQLFSIIIMVILSHVNEKCLMLGHSLNSYRCECGADDLMIVFLHLQERHADSLIQNQHYQVCTCSLAFACSLPDKVYFA